METPLEKATLMKPKMRHQASPQYQCRRLPPLHIASAFCEAALFCHDRPRDPHHVGVRGSAPLASRSSSCFRRCPWPRLSGQTSPWPLHHRGPRQPILVPKHAFPHPQRSRCVSLHVQPLRRRAATSTPSSWSSWVFPEAVALFLRAAKVPRLHLLLQGVLPPCWQPLLHEQYDAGAVPICLASWPSAYPGLGHLRHCRPEQHHLVPHVPLQH
mmetsp:Transcript_69372/g.137140  ORF Transcript_69372/g.137140 Transcript_69372/m.137140 type:complete len:213 (-) Transcript_69372:1760-2398(-)